MQLSVSVIIIVEGHGGRRQRDRRDRPYVHRGRLHPRRTRLMLLN